MLPLQATVLSPLLIKTVLVWLLQKNLNSGSEPAREGSLPKIAIAASTGGGRQGAVGPSVDPLQALFTSGT